MNALWIRIASKLSILTSDLQRDFVIAHLHSIIKQESIESIEYKAYFMTCEKFIK